MKVYERMCVGYMWILCTIFYEGSEHARILVSLEILQPVIPVDFKGQL